MLKLLQSSGCKQGNISWPLLSIKLDKAVAPEVLPRGVLDGSLYGVLLSMPRGVLDGNLDGRLLSAGVAEGGVKPRGVSEDNLDDSSLSVPRGVPEGNLDGLLLLAEGGGSSGVFERDPEISKLDARVESTGVPDAKIEWPDDWIIDNEATVVLVGMLLGETSRISCR